MRYDSYLTYTSTATGAFCYRAHGFITVCKALTASLASVPLQKRHDMRRSTLFSEVHFTPVIEALTLVSSRTTCRDSHLILRNSLLTAIPIVMVKSLINSRSHSRTLYRVSYSSKYVIKLNGDPRFSFVFRSLIRKA